MVKVHYKAGKQVLAEDKGVSVRMNLKEVLGKTLLRRTETMYEALCMGKVARQTKARYLHGNAWGDKGES